MISGSGISVEKNLFEDIEEFFDVVDVSHKDVVRSSTNVNLDVFYKKLADLGYNLDELENILECRDSMLILSGAGSGKTTALILKLIRDLLAGDVMRIVDTGVNRVMIPANILVCTFLKSAAGELRTSFLDWCKKLGVSGIDASTIQFKTIHAEVYDVLKQLGVRVEILENTDSLVRASMQNFHIRSVLSTSKSITADEVSDIACVLTYARNRLDSNRYNHPLMGDYGLDTVLLNALLEDYKLRRRASGKMDFEDMQEMLLEGLVVNENVRNYIKNRYDYVYVDEFQDTSQLQYEIFKHYFNHCKKVIAIGDDDQTIYSWRGSDIDIITTTFNADYNPAIMQLTMNYRCAKNILNAVIPSIEKNVKRHTKKLRGCRPDGVINVVENGSVTHLINSVKEDLSNQWTVGVLARTNADLLIPAILLELDGSIDFGLSKSVSLDNRIAKQVTGVMDLVTKRFTDEFEGYFKLFLPRYSHHEAGKLDNVLRTNKDLTLFNIPAADLKHSVPTLAPFILGLWAGNQENKVLGYLRLLDILVSNVYVGKSIYAKKARDFVTFVKQIIIEHDTVKNMNIVSLDRLFNIVLPERLARRIKFGNGVSVSVKLSTVHEAKGKEWDSVYIWNNVEGCFPNYVGNRGLTDAEFEEERRVHYIAWTRAKRKITSYTHVGCRGAFLAECDLSQASNIVDMTVNASTPVFKKGTPMFDARGYFSRYLMDKQNTGDLTDTKVWHVEMLLRSMPKDELLDDLVAQLDIENYPVEYRESAVDDYLEAKINALLSDYQTSSAM